MTLYAPPSKNQLVRMIDNDGMPIADLPESATAPDKWLRYYKQMVLSRILDQKIIALQRTGQLGTYPSCLGQEAIGTVMGMSLKQEDVLVPYYRDQAAQLARGVSIEELLLYWGGDERGCDFKQCREDFPVAVPIATQITHAAGVASAFKVRKQSKAVITSCGDGATSRGDFYESLNLAGVWQLPLVIIVNNNQWAISVPIEIQTAAETIAHKAQAAGIEGIRVDGNDALALDTTITAALEKAYAGKGATLIEAVSYRLTDHTTADDASRYRSHSDVKANWQYEPIKRLRQFLLHQQWWNETKEKALVEQCKLEIDAAVEIYLNYPKQSPEAMIDYLYSELPIELYYQRNQLIQRGGAS